MDTDTPSSPSVVSVMVVHQPGDWFDDTLTAMAAQDYPNLRHVFLVTGDDHDVADVEARINAVVPNSFVRRAPSSHSFGESANDVLRLVDGDNGFFLICHDDVAPAPDAVRVMVGEMFRSNAGIVGPKLVEWDDPMLLQHVGLAIDRFGEIDPLIDPGEVDQEQHDAVRDVFVIPSAFMLVRADLFRSLGGFDPAITFYGEAVDLCWRAHHTGARVIVAPDARVAHRERLAERRSDLNPVALQSRHRMRAVAVNTGGSRLVPRSLQMVVLTVVELVVGLFTGRFGESLASLRALGGLLPRTGSLLARRRAISDQRVVPEQEVIDLQHRGSSRLSSYLRGREVATYVGEESTVRRWRQATFGPLLAWFLILLGLAIGSREFFLSGVPSVGEFLPFPDSPSDLFAQYRSAFDNRGLGATSSTPTGWAAIAFGSVLTLFRMGLFETLFIVGAGVVGAAGAWRLAQVFPINRARVAAVVVYAATPLLPTIFGTGDLSALMCFAGLPWLVYHLRRFVGIEAADPAAVVTDLPDGIAAVPMRRRIRTVGLGSIVLGLVAGFAPAIVGLWVATGVLLAIGTLIARASIRVAAELVVGTLLFAIGGTALNLPWSTTWGVDDLAGAGVPSTGRSFLDVLTLGSGHVTFAVLGLALYVPVAVALLIARAWRFTWTARASLLVVVFGAAMVLNEMGAVGVPAPTSRVLAVPLVLGLSLGAAAMMGGFSDDVLGRDFGWRQPTAVIGNAALAIGLVPAMLAVGSGDWGAQPIPTASLIGQQFPSDPIEGDYRVLYVGDPRVLPVPGREYADGIAYAITDSGDLDITDRWLNPRSGGDVELVAALDLIASGSTLRAGRLLAPLGIRFVVVPTSTGVVDAAADDLSRVPPGLIESLDRQLDIGRVEARPSLEVYRNVASMPVVAQLTGDTAAASTQAGAAATVRADLTAAAPLMPAAGLDIGDPDAIAAVEPGVVHVAVPFDDHLRLDIEGTTFEPRPSFGVATAFDVDAAGTATGELVYDASASRMAALLMQLLLWIVAIVAAASPSAAIVRRRTSEEPETLVDFSVERDLDTYGDEAGELVAATTMHPQMYDPGLTGPIELTAEQRATIDDDDDRSPA